nr:unnamed protein product [Digitaria exilis]
MAISPTAISPTAALVLSHTSVWRHLHPVAVVLSPTSVWWHLPPHLYHGGVAASPPGGAPTVLHHGTRCLPDGGPDVPSGSRLCSSLVIQFCTEQ